MDSRTIFPMDTGFYRGATSFMANLAPLLLAFVGSYGQVTSVNSEIGVFLCGRFFPG